jgi:sec-independent protein translocase protein TatB
MLTFGWGEILLVLVVVIVVVGPKDLPKLIKQFSTFAKSLKKLSREFKYSLNEIADQEEFKEINKTIMEAKNIKDDLNIKDKFKSEVKSLKETANIIEKEVKDLKNLENEINLTKETSTLVEKEVDDKNKNKTQDEADLI